MILEAINVLAAYLLVSLLFRFILQLIPKTIRSGFESLAEARRGLSMFVMSIYKSNSNIEVLVLAVLLLPFSIFYMVFAAGSVFVYFNTEFYYINVWLVLLILFVISFLAPTPAEMQFFAKVSAPSVLFFFFKLFLVLELMRSYPELEGFVTLLLITPISPLLRVE